MADERIVKLSDSNKTTDYFPVSVSEAIYHKDKENKVIPVSEAINKIENDLNNVFDLDFNKQYLETKLEGYVRFRNTEEKDFANFDINY